MVIGPDGPDRDIYRVSVGSKLAFTFENRTDVPMTVLLEGFGISTGDCLPRGSRGVVIASYKERATTPLAAPATPPDNCLVPPHGSVSIDKYEALSGPATVIVMPSGGDYWAGYPVIFDLVGNSE
jgi:hypothetical protein